MSHKRITAVGLALAAVLMLAGSALAEIRDFPVTTQQLSFVYRNATRSNSFRDSSIATQKASYAGNSLVDTTESIDMRNAHYRHTAGFPFPLIMPANAAAGKWSIVDTLVAFSVTYGDFSGTARAGADSVGLAIQISADNVTWTSIDTIGTGSAQVIPAGAAVGSISSSIVSAGQATFDVSSTLRAIGKMSINWDRTAANFIRFILREDPNAASGTQYAVFITTKRLGNVIPVGLR